MEPAKILADLGLANLEPEKQNQLVAAFAELVQSRLADKLSQQLDESTLTKLDELSAQSNDAETIARIQELVPNYTQLLEQTINETKAEMRQGMQAVIARLPHDA